MSREAPTLDELYGPGASDAEAMASASEEAYQSWRQTWDLDDMTLREIYEAGFAHGVEAGKAHNV